MILSFDEAIDFSFVGNKAKSLIELNKQGLNVPFGIVIDSNTYDSILVENKIDKSIIQCLTKLDKDNIKEISSKIIKLFDSVLISDDIKNNILKYLQDNKKYAVRSSGIKEDLDDFSFAGQYKTFLNVEKKNVLENIINCYKSMFSEVLLNYIVNNNIDVNEMKMAVIVQEMCEADYSGICFTCDPIMGNDKQMLIEIGQGLGENIVSGQNVPEQYYFNWFENVVSYDDKNSYLTKEQVSEYGKLFFDIHYFYGYPCDIEFAIKNKKLYILQARKITKLKYQGYSEMWSTADFKDGGVSATICYPYMWSLYEYIWEYTLKKFILDSKILSYKEIPQKLGEMFFARPYWNLSCVKLAMSQIVGYKEREFDSEFGVRITYDGNGAVTKPSIKSILKILRIAIAQSKIVKDRRNNAELLKNSLLDKYYKYKNDFDNNAISDLKKTWYELTHDDYLRSESTYFWQIFINTVHQSLYKDSLLKYVNETDYLTLLSSLDNISHLLPFYKMWEISRTIRTNKEEYDFWNSHDIESIVKHSQNNTEIQNLINMYGYHSDKELDVAYKCYYEDVSPLIISIKEMINLEDEYSPDNDKIKGRKEYEKILAKIKSNVSNGKFKKIEKKVKNMRDMLWWREEFRDVSTRFYYLIRVYTLRLANELLKEKVIDDIDDVWFLKVSNLWDYLSGRITIDEIKDIITKNKKYYYAYKNYMSENEIGRVFSEVENKAIKEDELLAKGLGANNGVIEGIARVVKNFDEIDKLKENDILITKYTDTGWTPKFAILSGIVTEYGGILCHAAIVAREYGIPAIVSCHDAMKKIKDGQKIRIDGGTGIVTILK